VKRLFAVSGNRCAFPQCSTPLVDAESGSIIGEICHIKGEKPTAARYDATQSQADRHGFDNLILLCGVHHKVVDDDEVAYAVERLVQMKQQHDARHASAPGGDDATAEQFATVALTNCTVHSCVVTTQGQSGGQAAHTINNYYYKSPAALDAAKSVLPTLSPASQKLGAAIMRHAIADGGRINATRTMHGSSLSAGRYTEESNGDRRVEAHWETVLQELTSAGLVQQQSATAYLVTDLGYRWTDALEPPGTTQS
jgi:hypothetical protein